MDQHVSPPAVVISLRSVSARVLLSCVLPSLQVRMGASSSSAAAAPAVRAEASVDAPPKGCPMPKHPPQPKLNGRVRVSHVLVAVHVLTGCPLLWFFSADPPPECPMHRAPAGPAHQDRAYEFVECPMKAARHGQSDIDPTNMVLTREVRLCLWGADG